MNDLCSTLTVHTVHTLVSLQRDLRFNYVAKQAIAETKAAEIDRPNELTTPQNDLGPKIDSIPPQLQAQLQLQVPPFLIDNPPPNCFPQHSTAQHSSHSQTTC